MKHIFNPADERKAAANRATLISRLDLATAAALFTRACRASRLHAKAAALAYARHGERGPLISGVEQSHFPPAVKNRLRRLATAVADYSDAAWRARPPRVRTDTMRALGRAIATRDGVGRYGPAAYVIRGEGRHGR